MTMTATSREEKQLAAAVASVSIDTEAEVEVLVPGLPDEVAEHCLLHPPFPYHTLARSVSTTWNRALTSAAFLRLKAATVLVPPPIHSILFVFAYHRLSLRLHWQALDPLSRRWFLLPPIPLLATSLLCPSSIATAAHPSRGELYVLGGMSADTQTPLEDRRVKVYEMEMDTWRAVEGGGVPVEVKRPYAVTGAENGKIYVAGKGFFVAVGMVAKLSGGRWKVEWEVVKGPPAMAELVPRSAHVLYV